MPILIAIDIFIKNIFYTYVLRWLKTVLRAVLSGIRQTNMAAKKAMVHRTRFLKIYFLKFCYIWQNFYFYRLLNNENFKMEVEQTNFCDTFNNSRTIMLLIISKTRLLKFDLTNKFQMVMINYSKLCESS